MFFAGRRSRKASSLAVTPRLLTKPLARDSIKLDFQQPPQEDKLNSRISTDESPNSHHILANSPISPSKKNTTDSIVYLKRKQVVDFLFTENLIQQTELHRYDVQKPRVGGLRTLHKKQISDYASTPRTRTLPTEMFTSISRRRSGKVFIPNSKGLIDDVVIEDDYRIKMAKFNPLSPKSLSTYTGKVSDKTLKIIKNHQHKIFGMDYINLKRINTFIKSKTQNTQNTQMKTEASQNIETSDILNLNKYQSAPNTQRLPIFSKSKVHQDILMKELGTFKNYEYNPLTDNFQYTDPDISQLENLLRTISPEKKPRASRIQVGNYTQRERNEDRQDVKDTKAYKTEATSATLPRKTSMRLTKSRTESLIPLLPISKIQNDKEPVVLRNKRNTKVNYICNQFEKENKEMSQRFRVPKKLPSMEEQ